jgi:hypothetical protein
VEVGTLFHRAVKLVAVTAVGEIALGAAGETPFTWIVWYWKLLLLLDSEITSPLSTHMNK